MPRYKLTIEYDGTGLFGWQRQMEVPSVQQHIEEAIGKFAEEEVRLHTAGRTDAGVHAFGQVAHARNAVADFLAQQHATPTRLCTLAHNDLDRIGFAQIVRVHTVARGQILIDQLFGMTAFLLCHAAIAGGGRRSRQ